ncbi:hypothetical protein ACGLWX_18270 [Halomonas sp. HMF6819]
MTLFLIGAFFGFCVGLLSAFYAVLCILWGGPEEALENSDD